MNTICNTIFFITSRNVQLIRQIATYASHPAMVPAPTNKKRSSTASAGTTNKSKRKSNDADNVEEEEDSSTNNNKSNKKPISAAEKKRRKANETKQQPLAFQKTNKYSVGMKLLLEDNIYGRPGDIPEEVRDHHFEYQVVSIDNSRRCTIKFNDLVIKPGADKFRAFKESDQQQQMEFCLDDLDDAREMWQKANGRCNKRTFLAM